MDRDSKQSVAMPYTIRLSGQALSSRKQQVVISNAVDHSAIRAGPQCEIQRAVSGIYALNHSAIRAALSSEKQQAVPGNTLDHPAIRACP